MSFGSYGSSPAAYGSYGSYANNFNPLCPTECAKIASNVKNENANETSFEKLKTKLVSLIDVGKTATVSSSSQVEGWEHSNETKYKMLLVSLFDIKTENVSSNIDKVLLLVKFYINNKVVPEEDWKLQQCYDHIFDHFFKEDTNNAENTSNPANPAHPSNTSNHKLFAQPNTDVGNFGLEGVNKRDVDNQGEKYSMFQQKSQSNWTGIFNKC